VIWLNIVINSRPEWSYGTLKSSQDGPGTGGGQSLRSLHMCYPNALPRARNRRGAAKYPNPGFFFYCCIWFFILMEGLSGVACTASSATAQFIYNG